MKSRQATTIILFLLTTASVPVAQISALDLDPYSVSGFVDSPIPSSTSEVRADVEDAIMRIVRTLQTQSPTFTLPDSIRIQIVDSFLRDPTLRDSLVALQVTLVPPLRAGVPVELAKLATDSGRLVAEVATQEGDVAQASELVRPRKGEARRAPLTVAGSLVGFTPTSKEALTAIAGMRVDAEVGSLPIRVDLKASGTDSEGFSFDSGTRSETFTAKLGLSLAPLLRLSPGRPGLNEVRIEAEGRPTLDSPTRYKGTFALTYQTPFGIGLNASAGYVEQRDSMSDELLQDASLSATASLPFTVAGRSMSSSLSYRHRNSVEKDESITLGLGATFSGPLINGVALYLDTNANVDRPGITLSISRTVYSR